MKYFKKGAFLLPVVLVFLFLCACGGNETQNGGTDTCNHTYSTEWDFNEKEHFHRATCEHKDLTKDNEPHQFTEWKPLDNEKEERRVCMVCRYQETRPKEEKPHECSYGKWNIDKEPTLEETGKISRVCILDETHKESLDLPKLNGKDYVYKVEIPSSCSAKGEASYTYDLGTEKLKFTVELDYTPHSYGNWKMVKEPTKDKTGLLQRVCTNDETHMDEFEMPILNETDYTYTLTPKECLTDGKEVYVFKKDQQTFEIELPVLATGHPFEMKQDAYKHWLESNCAHHLIKDIQDHIYVDGVCSICNHTLAEDTSVLYELNSTEDGYIASMNPAYEGSSITILGRYLDLPVVELKKSSLDGKNIVFVTLPSSLQKIDEDVFAGFDKLNSVFYEGNISDWCSIVFTSKTSNPMYIADNFYQRKESNWVETTKLVLPNPIKAIGKYQFYGFSHIEEITLPKELEEIDIEAFALCSKVEELSVPDTVCYLGKDFLNGTNLKKLSLPFLRGKDSNNDSYIGYYFGVQTRSFTTGWNHQDKLSTLEELALTKETSLGEFALANLLNLKKVYLPDSLVELTANTVFSGCPKLEYNEYKNGRYLGNEVHPYVLLIEMIDKEATSFEFANHTKLIYDGGFQEAKITEIELPTTLVEIGEKAFYESALKSIQIPEGVSKIKDSTFYNCSVLEKITLPKELDTIADTAFSKTAIKKASLNLSVAIQIINETIEDLTIISGEGTINLVKYPNLKKVSLPEGISDLGSGILTSCTVLEYTVENNIAYLGNETNPHLWVMYAADKSIEEVNISEDAHYIYENAFKDCTNLKGVRIPNRIQKIEESAFSGCSKLSYVYFTASLSSIKTIEQRAFAYCISLTTMDFPKSLTYIGEAALGGCVRISSLTLPFVGATPNPSSASSNTLFTWIFGNLYLKDGEYSMASIKQQYSSSSSTIFNRVPAKIKEVHILGGKILYGAFSGFGSATIEKVNIDIFTLTKNVEVKSNLKGGLQPKYLTTPYEYLSRFDTKEIVELTLITPGEEFNLNGSEYYYIEKIAFAGMKRITHSNYYVKTITNVSLPSDLEEIGANVFREATGLESIILPQSLKKIGSKAFEATTKLYYLGTLEEWNQIEKETIESPIYFYSETQIANGWHYVDGIPSLW